MYTTYLYVLKLFSIFSSGFRMVLNDIKQTSKFTTTPSEIVTDCFIRR